MADEQQARRDAEDLQRLRQQYGILRDAHDLLCTKYDTDVVREQRKADEWSARIVETTEKILTIQAENDQLRAENAQLAAIEQRAQRVVEGERERMAFDFVPKHHADAARYILHGDPAPGKGAR